MGDLWVTDGPWASRKTVAVGCAAATPPQSVERENEPAVVGGHNDEGKGRQGGFNRQVFFLLKDRSLPTDRAK